MSINMTNLSPIIIIAGTSDPTLVAVNASAFTLYLNVNTLNTYTKQDEGLTTNWTLNGAVVPDYTPADNTKWASPVPTSIKSAIDRISAVVGASTPIP